jgi:16S rRNA (guanine1207-N2)-methyltransferase
MLRYSMTASTSVIEVKIDQIHLSLETESGLFSPSAADRGTLAMIRTVHLQQGQRVLDLGCGYGIVGIWASLTGAESVLTDINPHAIACAKRNAARNGAVNCRFIESDGFNQIDEAHFDWILTNPPFHADYAVAKHFIEKGFNRLVSGGRMVMVVKKPDWYRNKLRAIFGGCSDQLIDSYHVLSTEKRNATYANHLIQTTNGRTKR